MNKCAFVIPLHPKHFHYGRKIFYALQESDADLYFVFTTSIERDQFFLNVNSLILSDFCNVNICKKHSTFVSIKKLYALSVLYSKYEYICCMDAEVSFLRTDHFYEMMKDVVESKYIFGGKNELYKRIISNSLTLLTPPEDFKMLSLLSKNFSLYTWWSNVPVYDCKYVVEFLCWIQFNHYTLKHINWYFFENLAYNYFCVLKKGYFLKMIPTIKSSLEWEDSRIIEKVPNLHWVNAKAFKQNPNFYKSFHIIFHLDRTSQISSLALY